MSTPICECSACTLLGDCQDIMFIQGDVVEVWFYFEDLEPKSVTRAILKSEKANLYVECPYSEVRGGFCFRLESEQTELLKPTIASYDLLLELADGNLLTVAHEVGFAVLKKRNNNFEEVGS